MSSSPARTCSPMLSLLRERSLLAGSISLLAHMRSAHEASACLRLRLLGLAAGLRLVRAGRSRILDRLASRLGLVAHAALVLRNALELAHVFLQRVDAAALVDL